MTPTAIPLVLSALLMVGGSPNWQWELMALYSLALFQSLVF
jgi:hypothetical protein